MTTLPAVPVLVPRPADEEQRLAVLRGLDLLDTLPEEAYDDIVALAGQICGSPIAALSLVDDERQWFKAIAGLTASETSREVSFCAHAILEPDELLVVHDAQRDPRFVANPLVAGDPGIRFYAGTPLLVDAQPVGALCVIDTVPRELTEGQLAALRALGRQVVAQFELRRQVAALDALQRELRASEQRYRRLADLDPLTGVGNRNFLSAHLAGVEERSCGVLFLDLNGFKGINDELGHAAGDALLVTVGQRLREQLREGEVVARIGGDEFVVAQSPSSADALAALRARVTGALSRPFEHPSGPLTVRASIGTASRSEGSSVSAEELLCQADVRMYEEKCLPSRGRPVTAHAERAAELLHAITSGEIAPRYQLIWELSPGDAREQARPVGAEALARWTTRTGVLAPPAFLPDVETCGLTGQLGRAMLRAVVRDTAWWQSRRQLRPDFRLHVNVAAAQLHTGELPDLLRDLQAGGGADLRRLCLEVTESGLLRTDVFSPAEAAALKELGVEFALDDFGTGYSSLTQLRAYPFDTLKIDRTFVAELPGSERVQAIVASALSLAADLGMHAVAEGVEDDAQLDALRRLGCTRFQGFLFDRPDSREAVLARLDRCDATAVRRLRDLPVPRPAAERVSRLPA